MKCPHCARVLFAQRTGHGVRVRYGEEPAFVIAAACPYPTCAEPIFARATTHDDESDFLDLLRLDQVVSVPASAVLRTVSQWAWPLLVLFGFSLMPLWGASSALESLRCGGIGFFFFAPGTALTLIPVIYFVRGFGWAALEGLRLHARARDQLRAGGAGGLRLAPNPESGGSYRGY